MQSWEKSFQTYRLIFMGVLMTPVVYAGLAYIMTQQSMIDALEGPRDLIQKILIMVSALIPLILLGLKSFFLGQWERSRKLSGRDILSQGIILFAIGELPGILGLMGLILGALTFAQSIYFFGGAAVCLFLAFVKKENWDALIKEDPEV